MKSISKLLRQSGHKQFFKGTEQIQKRLFSLTNNKFENENLNNETKKDPKINLLQSKRVFTKSSVNRVKTRVTATELPKKNPKEEKKWPKCKAVLRQCPGSPHRLMQIADYVRGLSARQALKDLETLNRRQSIYVYKLIQSAMFNGENNIGLNAERLVIHEIFVTKGRTRKRYKIHARGKYGVQITRWSHLTVILAEVPELENERRLGSRGWTNERWDKFYQSQMDEQIEEEVEFEPEEENKQEMEQQQKEEEEEVVNESKIEQVKEEEEIKK
eukprot:gene4418-7793_t